MDRSRFDSCLPYVLSDEQLFLRKWVDLVRFEGPKGGPCLACEKPNSCQYYDSQAYFTCSYCGLTVTFELIASMCSDSQVMQAPPAQHIGYFLGQIKRDWKRRKELVEGAGIEFLVEVLNTKGFHVKLPKYEHLGPATYLNVLNAKPEPKPWSYKDRAASEFNVKPDESGLV